MKIKKGDNVIVIAGKDKGKTGAVLRTFPNAQQVLVDGINRVTRHQKNRRSRSQGQVIEKNMPVHVSNVACVLDGKPVRVGYKIEDSKKDKKNKIRIARPSGKNI